MRIALAFLFVACSLPRAAHAGRSFYGWLYGTEVMPERGVELQTWISEEDGRTGSNQEVERQSSIWLGPLIGVTDQLEISLPLEMDWTGIRPVGGSETTKFTFKRFGIEAHYRLVSSDPVEAPALVPLVRVAVKRDVIVRDDVRIEADAVASYEVGGFHAQIDLGFIADTKGSVKPARFHSELRPGGGISVRVAGDLRLGAEAYAQLSPDSNGPVSWAAAGPNVSWTHGRFWLSGAFGIGLYHLKAAPRVVWGIAF